MLIPTLLQQAADTSGVPDGVIRTVNQFTDFLLGYLLALAAIGALAMALIEAWKKLYDARTRFQLRRFVAWIQKSFPEHVLNPELVPRLTTPQGVPVFTLGPVGVIADLLQLGTGISRREAYVAAQRLDREHGTLPILHVFSPDPAHAIFSLDIERMMGALQDAGDVALNTPGRYPALYAFMTIGGRRDDVNRWFSEGEQGFTAVAARKEPTPEDRKAVKSLADVGAQLRQVMKRRLDSFQLITADRWANWNQFSAVLVGALAMFGVLMWLRATRGLGFTLSIVPLSLFGGVLSPVAKDLVTSLKRVKNG